jgi:ABC-type metal ion transport system substrate-binding protein
MPNESARAAEVNASLFQHTNHLLTLNRFFFIPNLLQI